MKSFVLLFAIAATAYAASIPEPVPILKQDQDISPDGSFSNSFEAGNGISAQASGVLKNAGQEGLEAEEVQGSFSYTADDGTPIQLSYVANENGFQPKGAHLPVAPVDTNTPPPVPAAIARALEWIAAHPSPESQAN
ncbi:endocuticle structural glycoprotein SgAbd-2-like [Rhynchophorus ferrugineus]|uniref:endocuticle structural glycoprotein SgAbd-2-like n=1 Tax=Rhynchophorus ferrugineus TaxID=354439 RepID=UPI003FCCE2B0